jgi:hypothetical protein
VKLARIIALSLAGGAVFAAACAKSGSMSSPQPAYVYKLTPPSPDPRVGLAPGTMMRLPSDTTRFVVATPAREASWNMRLLSATPPSRQFAGVTNSDLAFIGNDVIQGNYNGYQVWNISSPTKPALVDSYLCPASQSDVSVYRNLLFVSAEGLTGRHDCGTQGVPDSVSAIRVRGVRIFDITDLSHPRYIKDVQTCRGSHTHTVVVPPNDPDNIYVYVSGTAGVRPEAELAGCSDLSTSNNPNSSQFRIEVIKVPVAHPELADRVSQPRIFQDLAPQPVNTARNLQDSVERAEQAAARAAAGGGRGGRGGGRAAGPPRPRTGPTQCHDITVYPWAGLAGGACAGYGLLLDISDPANPRRLYAAADSNFSFWHSATFSNDGSKVLFTDEWGGGSAPRCRSTDKYEWGADALFTIENKDHLTFHSYYKMPAPQTAQENCVAHNGSLIPIPGRDVMVQSWYQGGVSVFDWTDVNHPYEMAFFDRGPLEGTRLASGGTWSAYWYNGVIVSSEIARGLDVFELSPSPALSQNEIDAAKLVHLDYLNTQDQPHFTWPANIVVAKSYADQLTRTHGVAADRATAISAELNRIGGLSGSARRDALNSLAGQVDGDARGAADVNKVRMLASELRREAGM